MVDTDEFNEAWQKIQNQELFELDIDDQTLLIGWKPDFTQADQEEVFSKILPSSMAYCFLQAAWRFSELRYVVSVNGILVGFWTAFGWSFLTENSYIAGNMPKDWRNLHDVGKRLLLNLLSETQDIDYPKD